jgi:putative radical SAM enzyme (TIGR03279 family)
MDGVGREKGDPLKPDGVLVVAVLPGSLAEHAGIHVGDRILEINGQAVLDQLSYQFLVSQRDRSTFLIKHSKGQTRTVRISNGGDGIGVDLAQDPVKVCRQNCVFCFVQQMPKGFRKSLYLKDEDIRLSFLYGHFTTLSNSDDKELDRMVRERLSPIHVSVHATDPAARVRLVGNPREGDILRKLDRLIEGGIEMHTQVVVVPGYNDGAVWEKTLSELWERRAHQDRGRGGVLSLSCVPVGLTAHRPGLARLSEVTPEFAQGWVKRWIPVVRSLTQQNEGEPWLLLADEWFTRANVPIPGRSFYSPSWEQLENGVGLIRRFLEQSRRFIPSRKAKGFRNRSLLLLTGASFAPYLEQTVARLNAVTGSRLRVATVGNQSFGLCVTVAGLLCGRDLLTTALQDIHERGPVEAVVVPRASLTTHADPTGQYEISGRDSQNGEGIFLDDLHPSDLARELGLPVLHGGDNFSQLLDQLNALTPSSKR